MDASIFDEFDALGIGASSLSDATVSVEKIKTPDELRAEWEQSRRGIFTASAAHRLMGYENKPELPAGAITYATEKAIEKITRYNPERASYKSSSMRWGNETELEAIAAVEEFFGVKFECTGENQQLIKPKGAGIFSENMGGSPDGIYYPDGYGIETKCPNSTTHFEYLQIKTQEEFKKICKDYYYQCQQLMYCAGFNKWLFVSYDPDFISEKHRLFMFWVNRCDADISLLLMRTTMAISYRDKLIATLG